MRTGAPVLLSLLLPVSVVAQGFPDDSAAARWIQPAIEIRAELSRDSLRPGDTVQVKYKVRNVASRPIEICLGKAHGADLVVREDTLHPFVFELVDHESCVRRDRLGSGQSVVWQRALNVPDISARGSATLLLWVDVVDPADCHVFGCGRAVVNVQ